MVGGEGLGGQAAGGVDHVRVHRLQHAQRLQAAVVEHVVHRVVVELGERRQRGLVLLHTIIYIVKHSTHLY